MCNAVAAKLKLWQVGAYQSQAVTSSLQDVVLIMIVLCLCAAVARELMFSVGA